MSPAGQPNRFHNIVANYAGVASTLIVQIFLVPLYVRLLGTESYGVIGFFMTLQALLLVMDFGLGMSLNRELARRSVTPTSSATTGTLVRTLEILSWCIGTALGLLVVLAAPLIAQHWLITTEGDTQALILDVRLMGVVLALQWPQSIYAGGLLGLQKQVRTTIITVASNVLFALGAIVLLKWSPELTTFFLWRGVVSLGTTLIQRRCLWDSIEQPVTPRFNWSSLREVSHFTLGMTTVALTGIALVQLDKVVISWSVPLDQLGAYMVASTAAFLIPQLVSPIFTTLLPAFSQAFTRDSPDEQSRLFRLESQLIATFVHPAAISIALFSGPALTVWTNSSDLSRDAAPILSLLAIGAILNSLMVPLYSVQLAAGWTHLATRTNVVLLALMVPFSVFASSRWGSLGAATTAPVMNAVYLAIGAWTTLRLWKISHPPHWRWHVLRPVLYAAFVLVFARLAMPTHLNRLASASYMVLVTLLALVLAVVVQRDLRNTSIQFLRESLNRLRSH